MKNGCTLVIGSLCGALLVGCAGPTGLPGANKGKDKPVPAAATDRAAPAGSTAPTTTAPSSTGGV
jgi:hypothetical protein